MILPEKFLKKVEAEAEAERVLAAYLETSTTPLSLPVAPDLIAEIYCDLTIDWDVIAEPTAMRDGRVRATNHGLYRKESIILAGLYPRSRRIVMNEEHVEAFRKHPALYRFTIAHEIGHWFLHIDHAALNDETPSLFGDELFAQPIPEETIICRDGDDTWIERQANWFAAALLMPRSKIIELITPAHLLNWDTRYELAERFGVSISAFSNRLKELGIGDADDAKRLYTSPAEKFGQMRLR